MLEPTSVRVTGDPTGAEPRYFSVIDGATITAPDIRTILRKKYRDSRNIELNPVAISHLLHDGFVPQPHTVYKDIFVVSIGMSATLRSGRPSFDFSFPFTKAASRRDSEADPAELLRVLTIATREACEAAANPLLMLSAGLDSTSLALAAKEAGRDDVLCVTYGETDDLEEAEFARKLCQRLGLRHETYCLDISQETACQALRGYAALTPEPCADPALTACLAPVARYSSYGTVILDGSGNDTYFWKPPRRLDLAKLHLPLHQIPGISRLRGLIPLHLRYERLLSSPLERVMFAGPHLRHCDTRMFYPVSVDTHRIWHDQLQRLGLLPEDVRSSVRTAFMGPAAHMMKARNAAIATGSVARFPWANHAVADYCFNLPDNARFDRAGQKSKILIREMLHKYVAYDEARIGKRVFKFNKHRFVEQHLHFFRQEIVTCSLWDRSIERVFDNLSRRFRRGARTENALLNLLMVSLWHTHWVERTLPELLTDRQSDGVAA
jgi:asparagine synthase (glutamine-hydrolysing)